MLHGGGAGMSTLLKAMAQRERLSVKFGVSVTSLDRSLNDEAQDLHHVRGGRTREAH